MADSPNPTHSETGFRWTVLAAVLAVCGVAGSLWLSLGMNLKACPLCLYQRAFIMSAAAVLVLGLLTDIRRSTVLPLLALPLIVGGCWVATFHEYLERTGRLECPAGLFGLGSAPQQSLTIYLALLISLAIPLGRPPARGGPKFWQIICAISLGLLIGWGTIKSAPPMPAAPTKPYDQPLEICRPPFRPA